MTLCIVPTERKDLSQVLAIERASFPLPYSENLFQMEIDLSVARFFVARDGDCIKGYIDFWHTDNELHLINIAVAPADRRKGIAAFMMDYLMDYGRKNQVARIYLDVRSSNMPAISLYKKFGFEKVDVRRGYYADNREDAYVMRYEFGE